MTIVSGDRVHIMAKYVPGTGIVIVPGTIGIVVKHGRSCALDLRVAYRDEFGEEQEWFFGSGDVEYMDEHTMVEPMFDLDDMELAEILIEEMK